ncbi:MAG TPA: hypothetical protein VGI41_09870, partial [Candidatus Udaeobacter sp.]
GDTIRIRECDLKTGGVAAELLEASITDWDGAAGTVKFELHTKLYGQVDSRGKIEARENFSWGMLMAAFDSATGARENSWPAVPQAIEMAAHRKSDRRRVCPRAGGLRKGVPPSISLTC